MINFLQLTEIKNIVDAGNKMLAKDSIPVVSDLANTYMALKDKPTSEVIQELWTHLMEFSLKVFAALAIYFIGFWIIKKMVKLMKRIFAKKHTDPSLAGFIVSFSRVALIILLIVIIIGVLGINTTSFAALIASGGLAVGMAMSGTLQNFAGGVMLLAFKPFKVGDFVEVMGYAGHVKNVAITTTTIVTTDNNEIIIPNGTLSNSSINNYSSAGKRRVEWIISLSYGDSFDVANTTILSLFKDDSRIIQEIEPVVYLKELADSSIEICVRAWVKLDDYWDVFFDYNQKFYKELPKAGLHFPYPHLSVDINSKDE